MKICPQCRQTYADDGLNFCLNDGSVLSVQRAEPEARTMVFEATRPTNDFGRAPQMQTPAVWQNQGNIQTAPNAAMASNYQSKDKSLPIISILLGAFSLVLTCFIIGIPLGIGAIVTGAIALKNENANPDRYTGRGIAIGGIVTGAIGLAAGFLMLILYSL